MYMLAPPGMHEIYMTAQLKQLAIGVLPEIIGN
jgi:hypothetical protein